MGPIVIDGVIHHIGTGGDSHRFEIVDTNKLNMTSVATKLVYEVNVTASGSDVFSSGNNWRDLFDVTVTEHPTV